MKKKLFLLVAMGIATAISGQVTVRGVVTGKEDEPLPGANVVLENTYYGTSTDADGNFELQLIKPGQYVLSVSFTGYETRKTSLAVTENSEITIRLSPAVYLTEEVMVKATRVKERSPVAYTNLTNEKLQSLNMGVDVPYLLNLTPSFVATSDAGTGIGYTSFRIRGTDLNRINITVNGIPFNDAESHSTYFVDQPDFASSAENIQIQRGAGTSATGSASFGAAINFQTMTLKQEPYAEYQATAGMFNTFRNTVSAGSGLISDKFTFDARLSKISSDGFIDRAGSDLKSFFLSAGYYSSSTILKVNLFSGWEETYLAWNGVPSVRLKNDEDGMKLYGEHGHYSYEETQHMLLSGSRTYNLYTYENEIDHYQHDNCHVHFSQQINPHLNMNIAFHLTSGRGYYEQFRKDEKYGDYGLDKPVINGIEIPRFDLVRRKWLDNDFYGTVYSFNYLHKKTDVSWGGGWNKYDGLHFGKLVWGEILQGTSPGWEWYRNQGAKTDFNTYAKINYSLTGRLNFFADVQYRSIDYTIDGRDDDLRELGIERHYHFFNPKSGIFFQMNPRQHISFAYARAHREPNRDNFVDAPAGENPPDHETLDDFELGWNIKTASFTAAAVLYYMNYHDQLVLTGQINDVGAPIMTNVEKSFRKGVEFNWGIRLLSTLRWEGTATLSRNKIRNFTEHVDDWDNGGQQSFYRGTTDLSFSPATIGGSQLKWQPGNFSVNLMNSYTGKQFIDNSSSGERIIDPSLVTSLKCEYLLKSRIVKNITFHLLINNLFNVEYESNAWVYSYILDGKRYKTDGYFPQAGRNFLAGVQINL